MEKPSLPKGTRDFGPATMAKRQFIFNNIRTVFQKFGFQPLETPAMENLSTLTGKYGEEGDQLLFKILNSGDFLKNFKTEILYPTRIKHHSNLFFHRLFAKYLELNLKDIEDLTVEIFEFEKIDHLLSRDAITAFLEKNKNEIITVLGDYKKYNEGITEFNSLKKYTDALKAIPTFSTPVLDKFDQFITRFLIDRYNSQHLTKDNELSITEKGLRYDLTVPFARYVVMNRHEISFPFKRYQIQPVWRADRPQKGRYREFYQCDADVVGTSSLVCEAEIILMIKEVFKGLNITDYTIKINHRGILSGIAEVIGAQENATSLFVAIDKLDKIGEEKVKEELRLKGFTEESLTLLFNILNVKGSITNKMAYLSTKFETSKDGQKGLRDMKEVFNLLDDYKSDESHVDFDVTLARGLSYYTGCIFEVKINNVIIGSVSGGGRYDNLTQAFGDKENLSGVGFSFGVDRIYDAMEELNLFAKDAQVSSKVLICHFDDESMRYGLAVLSALRNAGIATEIYPDQSKIKKQLDYANKKMIPYTIVIGSDEIKSGKLAFKNMELGEQENVSVEEIIRKIK
jgi:histidyl-tRNA synthetase